MGKRGNLEICILRIGNTKLHKYKPKKNNNLVPLKEIIGDFESRVDSEINGECDFGCLDFDTNYSYKCYSDHFDEWIKKYDLTISIYHSYGDDSDYGDRTELYYLGKYATNYTLDKINDIHMDDIIAYTLNKTNAIIINKMQKDIHKKVIQLLKQQCVNTEKN
jgi:hypothetical protein